MHKHTIKIIIISAFLVILAFIIYTSLFGGFSFIGRTIMGEPPDLNRSIEISANLGIPSLSLEGEFSQIVLRGSSDSFLYSGDKKFSLEGLSDNYIVISDYDGSISLDAEQILKLKGKGSQISVNGVIVSSNSEDTIKIYFDEPFFYNSVSISDGVLIRELNYKTSGKIILGEEKTLINLEDDNLLMTNFQGKLKAEEELTLVGHIESLDITGHQSISVSS